MTDIRASIRSVEVARICPSEYGNAPNVCRKGTRCRLRFGLYFRLWWRQDHFYSPVTCVTLGIGVVWSDWKMRFRSTSLVLGTVTCVML